MKALFILTYYYPHWTGLTQYAQRLAEGLVNRKFDVTVLATQYDKKLRTTEVVNKVKIIRKPFLFRLSRTLVSPMLIFSFWREIQKNDVVVVYLPFAEVLIAVMVAKIFQKKIFLVHNGDLVLPKSLGNTLVEKFYYYTTSWAIKLSNGIIIQTEDYGNHSKLLAGNKNKWKVVLPLYQKHSVNKAVYKDLKSKISLNKKSLVGFAGRFVEEKGFDFLLKAIPLVVKKFPQVLFVFAGETQVVYENFYQQHLKQIDNLKDKLTILGLLENKEVSALFRLCQAVVIPSRTDCFPSVGVEAILSGTPVIVADIPGARWPVKQTGMGLVVKAGNERALAQGIIEVLSDRSKFINKRQAEKIFSYENTLNKYEELFRQRA